MQPNSENEDKANVYLETLRIDKYLTKKEITKKLQEGF